MSLSSLVCKKSQKVLHKKQRKQNQSRVSLRESIRSQSLSLIVQVKQYKVVLKAFIEIKYSQLASISNKQLKSKLFRYSHQLISESKQNSQKYQKHINPYRKQQFDKNNLMEIRKQLLVPCKSLLNSLILLYRNKKLIK